MGCTLCILYAVGPVLYVMYSLCSGPSAVCYVFCMQWAVCCRLCILYAVGPVLYVMCSVCCAVNTSVGGTVLLFDQLLLLSHLIFSYILLCHSISHAHMQPHACTCTHTHTHAHTHTHTKETLCPITESPGAITHSHTCYVIAPQSCDILGRPGELACHLECPGTALRGVDGYTGLPAQFTVFRLYTHYGLR